MAIELRHYQARAVEELRHCYRSGARSPLLVMSTGAGKTVVFSAITAGATERGRRVLILVHRRELIRQASAKLTHAGVPHGIIAAGFPASDQPVQVASVQTLVRRLDGITWAPDLMVIDEAHHAVAGSWSQVLSHWSQAFRLGVTATPVRRDGRGLGAMFDRLVLGPSVQDLTAQGFLTPAKIYAPRIRFQEANLRVRSGDYAPEQAAELLDKPTVTGDAIEHFQRLGRGRSAIAFCCTQQHAEHVASQFRACGLTSQVLLGSTPVDEREQLLTDLGTGALRVLVSVDVISEGTDVPSVGAAILLRPTQSEGLYLQQVGRVLRPAPGKAEALILDHVGNVHRHGFPDDHRDWTLDDTRKRGRGGGATAPSVRTCPSCFAAFRPQLLCPVCGTYTAPPARELRQVGGELVQLTRDGLPPGGYKKGDIVKDTRFSGNEYVVLAVSPHRLQVTNKGGDLRLAVGFGVPVSEVVFVSRPSNGRREQGRAQTLQDLIRLGHARGMRNPAGWARHVYNARQRKNGA